MNPVRIMIVDDHTVMREGLAGVLGRRAEFEVVAVVSSVEQALREATASPCDVAVVDLVRDGSQCVRRLKQAHPRLAVMIFSMAQDERSVLEALEAGASGYVVKTAKLDEVVTAIISLQQGGSYLHHSVAGLVLQASRVRRPEAGLSLTQRELEALNGVLSGCSNKEIGEAMSVSVGTVKKHLQGLFSKFGVEDRTQLAMEAIKRGFRQVGAPREGP